MSRSLALANCPHLLLGVPESESTAQRSLRIYAGREEMKGRVCAEGGFLMRGDFAKRGYTGVRISAERGDLYWKGDFGEVKEFV